MANTPDVIAGGDHYLSSLWTSIPYQRYCFSSWQRLKANFAVISGTVEAQLTYRAYESNGAPFITFVFITITAIPHLKKCMTFMTVDMGILWNS